MGEDEEDKIKNDDEEEEKVLADWVTTPAPKFGIKNLNSHAFGMAEAQPLDFEIDFTRNPNSGSAA